MIYYEDPLQAMLELKKQIDRLFGELVSSFHETIEAKGYYEPPYDLEETDNEYIIRVDLPGFNKEEIKVKLTEDTVEVKAEKSEAWKAEDKEKKYIVKQRIYDSYKRIIKLPEKVEPDPSKIKYTFTNGVLELVVPKAAAKKEIELRLE
ncbi:MAG: hypothetical protein DRJ47_02700 [Thermoprotei archaeon]|nr:MAG: hypothetical protein DRJ47_02700 [Thermoprotei archaeon]